MRTKETSVYLRAMLLSFQDPIFNQMHLRSYHVFLREQRRYRVCDIHTASSTLSQASDVSIHMRKLLGDKIENLRGSWVKAMKKSDYPSNFSHVINVSESECRGTTEKWIYGCILEREAWNAGGEKWMCTNLGEVAAHNGKYTSYLLLHDKLP